LTITGSLVTTFTYLQPPACVFSAGPELGLVFFRSGAGIGLTVRPYHGVGSYTIPASFDVSLSQVNYAGNEGHWDGNGGSIQVVKANTAIVRGTVSATLNGYGQIASGGRQGDASVTGTWACIPPS